jgi:hypothetical protein
MKVRFSVTFDCEYTIDPWAEEWQMEDDDGKLSWNEDFALERLRDLIDDAPSEYASDYAEGITISALTIKGPKP